MTDFNRFVADTAASLLRSAYLITGDLHEAEDLVQEALHRTARRWHKVQRMDHPAAYARRIVVNLALDGSTRRRRVRAELAVPPSSHEETGSVDGRHNTASIDGRDDTASIDTHDELVAALSELPPRQRAVLVLRYLLDLPEAEWQPHWTARSGPSRAAPREDSRGSRRRCAPHQPHQTRGASRDDQPDRRPAAREPARTRRRDPRRGDRPHGRGRLPAADETPPEASGAHGADRRHRAGRRDGRRDRDPRQRLPRIRRLDEQAHPAGSPVSSSRRRPTARSGCRSTACR